MSSVNKVTLLGRLGKDPEIRHFENGSVVANTTLATTEIYTNKEGQKVENTSWHNVVFWRRLAEIVEKYVKKGDQIYIEGKIKYRSWEDQDGNKRYATDIEANNMVMLGKGRSNDLKGTTEEKVYVDASKNEVPTPVSDKKPVVAATEPADPKVNENTADFEEDLPF